MACAESLRVHALIDGELDAAEEAALARHLEGCAECRSLKAKLESLGSALKSDLPRHAPDAALRARLAALLDAEDRVAARVPVRSARPAYWWGAASGALAASLLAVALLVTTGRSADDGVERDVLAAHLRALVSGRAIDVESSDRHTVKPWFQGHVDVSPPVADFASDGFTLVGGRIDYVDGHRAAVVVYRHNAHVIDVFAWRDAGGGAERAASRNGYRLLRWHAGDLAFCAVSDTAESELRNLERLIRATLPADSRE